MRCTYGRVDKTDGLLANGKAGVVDGRQDGGSDGRRCGGAVHKVEFTLDSDDVVRAECILVSFAGPTTIQRIKTHPFADRSGYAREPVALYKSVEYGGVYLVMNVSTALFW